jgi:RimJ/RimL family protein N-acetyltransferase
VETAGIAVPPLSTDRLLLRAFRDQDLNEYARICADPEVMRYLGDGKPLSRIDAWRQMAVILGHWQLRGFGVWAVEERQSGALIGRLGFWQQEGWPGFELGWVLGRDWWHKGYATEGARVALDYGFSKLGREHVISLIHPDNHASVRVAERLGERLEGETEIFGHSVLIYGIRRENDGRIEIRREDLLGETAAKLL